MEAMHVLFWYIAVTVIGLLAWPMAFRLMPGLPDRGYTLSRALGLLVAGYIFWLLCSLGLLNNTTGGILFSILIMGGLGLWAYLGQREPDGGIRAWLAEHIGPVIVAEILFLLAFAGWSVMRAYNPALDHTEKPMELAFLSGVRGSQVFPPLDPWLSGYSISYYYFGYVIMAMLADLAGTSTSVAFNIGIALLFALTLLGSYGLVYNLVEAAGRRRGIAVSALTGPLLVGVMSNLEGFLELLRSINLPFIGVGFWQWLDIEDLTEPLSRALWPPDQWRFWWWWRASRVIRDRDLTSTAIGLQPIDEFPFFSFLLGDMHPHVLALPFVLMALALSFSVLAQKQRISWPQLGLMTICFGGLAFLNLSDWPIYFFILISVLAVRLVRDEKPQSWRDWLRPAFGFGMPLAGVLAYLPWHLSYRSQIGGILPNPIFATRFHQLFVMFGPFLVIIVWFLVDLAIRQRARFAWPGGIALGSGLLILLFGVMIGLGFITVQSSAIARLFLFSSTGASVSADAAEGALQSQIGQSMWAVIRHRLEHPLTPLVLTLIIIGALAYLLPLIRRKDETEGDEPADPPENASRFVVLLILIGALLILGPEFVYIRDVFGMRLNTIFKFYYAAWLVWAVASACALHMVLGRPRNGIHRVTQIVFLGVSILLITAGLVYPSFAIPTKAGDFIQASDRQPTLDGIEFIRRQYPSDYSGILWLQKNVEPGSVVLEAVGGSYTPFYARVSAATGLPTIIGWPGHENQWRGSLFGELAGGREEAVKEIYATTSVVRAQQLLDEYGVDYVFVGSLERNPEYASTASLEKFSQFLTLVFQDGDVDIYRVDKPLIKERP